jgi:hypothetical protein
MLKPVRGMPFNVIVKALAEQRVEKFQKDSPLDTYLLALLEAAIHHCAEGLTEKPIRRPRPNEVGNDVEPYVLRVIERSGLKPSKPTS